MSIKLLRKITIAVSILVFIVLYKNFNPEGYDIFPKCPFLMITGYKCPGCGSQRAIHHILNLEFGGAFRSNALLIIFLPYIITGFIFDFIKTKNPKLLKLRRFLFGKNAIIIVLVVVISFWIFRNLQF